MYIRPLLFASVVSLFAFSTAAVADDIRILDANSHITTYTYDPSSPPVYTTYDAHGTSSSAPAGNVTTYTYDAQTSTSNAGHTTTYTYDAQDKTTATLDTTTHTTTYSYNQFGNDSLADSYNTNPPTGSNNDNEPNAASHVQYQYDYSHSDPANRTTTQYDELGRTTMYQYDDGRGPASISGTDALGNTTTYTYDSLNRQIQVTDALGTTTGSVYDALGNTTIEFVAPTVTRYSYDALGNVSGETITLYDESTSSYAPLSGLLNAGDTYLFTYTYERKSFDTASGSANALLQFSVVPLPPAALAAIPLLVLLPVSRAYFRRRR